MDIASLHIRAAFLCGASLLCAGAFGQEGAVRGAFVQRKALRDVGVTLASSGTWEFEKGRSFVWRTERPVPSVFTATPTNYSFSAGGRTTTRRLEMEIGDIAQIFEIKEMKEFVERVDADTSNAVASVGGVAIPSSLRVLFRNGDRLEISLTRESCVQGNVVKSPAKTKPGTKEEDRR